MYARWKRGSTKSPRWRPSQSCLQLPTPFLRAMLFKSILLHVILLVAPRTLTFTRFTSMHTKVVHATFKPKACHAKSSRLQVDIHARACTRPHTHTHTHRHAHPHPGAHPHPHTYVDVPGGPWRQTMQGSRSSRRERTLSKLRPRWAERARTCTCVRVGVCARALVRACVCARACAYLCMRACTRVVVCARARVRVCFDLPPLPPPPVSQAPRRMQQGVAT